MDVTCPPQTNLNQEVFILDISTLSFIINLYNNGEKYLNIVIYFTDCLAQSSLGAVILRKLIGSVLNARKERLR